MPPKTTSRASNSRRSPTKKRSGAASGGGEKTAAKPPAPKGVHTKDPASLNLWGRIAWVQAKVGAVAKTGEVAFKSTKYKHMQEHGVIEVLRALLDEAGIVTITDYQEPSVAGNHIRATVRLQLVNIDEPEQREEFFYLAEGVDSSDKASNKLMTSGQKYALQKCFKIPTEDIDDVEGSDEAHNTPSTAAEASTISPQKATALRNRVTAAIGDPPDTTTRNKITAKLQAAYDTSKVGELTKDQAADFEQFLAEQGW